MWAVQAVTAADVPRAEEQTSSSAIKIGKIVGRYVATSFGVNALEQCSSGNNQAISNPADRSGSGANPVCECTFGDAA